MQFFTLRWKNIVLSLSLLVLSTALVACGSNQSTNNTPTTTPNTSNQPTSPSPPATTADPKIQPLTVNDAQLNPAKIHILSLAGSINDEEFNRTMAEPIKAKYPHHELTFSVPGGNVTLANLVAQGTSPDIIITSLAGMYSNVMNYELQYDISPLVKKYNYDLSRIELSTIESVLNGSGKGELYGLPKYLNGVVLFYNIDIFDRFGEDYPIDGMSWDEVLSLATKMTRSADGQNHRGLSLFYSNMINENQLSLTAIDPNADKANVNTTGYQKLFQMYKRVYDIVGNKSTTITPDAELTAFHKDKNIAMVMSPMSGHGRFVADQELNWDLVAAPTFADLPGIGYQPNTIYYFISNANGQAEQAFQVVTYLLEDETQELANKQSRPTILRDEAIRATLGQDHPDVKDKNFKAIFYNQFAPTPPTNVKVVPLVNTTSILNAEFRTMIQDGSDVNTMLRLAEEKINAAIQVALEGLAK